MSTIHNEIIQVFGNKLRVRVSGICIENDKILLVKHLSLGEKGILWAPPGGGISFGESAETSLKREFLEETGLVIEVKKFLFVHEFLEPPLHAMELFFEVKVLGGKLIQGTDPELSPEKQLINEVAFMSFEEILKQDLKTFHHFFSHATDLNAVLAMNGYYKYEKSEKKPKKS